MNKISRIIGTIVLILWFLALSIGIGAQNIVRKGNVFYEQQDSTRKSATKTQYLYIDKNGVQDTVYLSSKGTPFIFKVSKKTGKVYRKYLPKIKEEVKK